MKKINKKSIVSAAIIASFLLGVLPAATFATAPTVDATGNYVVDFEYLGSPYAHDVSLTQDNTGSLTGNGGSPAGANVYTWTITSGSVSGNSIEFFADYTATADAVTPQTTMHVTGTIDQNGNINGTWSDNYQGGARSGTFASTSGQAALLGTLSAEDFGVVNYDTGLGMLKGYTAGFGLADATFAGATSVVVKLYAGDDLLQTNTAILSKFNADITGTQFSSPFDVSGTFDYATDGYWTNAREAQYGQSVAATKVVATVTLSNGKIVTAENTTLTGDPASIFPPASHLLTVVLTGSGTGAVTSAPAGINCAGDCQESYAHGTQVALTATPASGSTFAGWSGACTGTGSCVVTMSSAVTATATFTLDPLPPTTAPTDKDQCKNGGWKTFTDPSFKNQGACISYVNHN